MNGEVDPYETLGLGRDCTAAQIRSAYRRLAKRWHPDVNGDSPEATARAQALNAAYEELSDPVRRARYDEAHPAVVTAPPPVAARRIERNVAREARLRVEEFLRGTSLEVRVKDPANPDGEEIYALEVPAGTAPGARLRVPREGAMAGGWVVVRLRLAPGRFTARGADLRTDLRITAARAASGGGEWLSGPAGGRVRVDIPAGVARNAVVRVPGEGLPRARGGRGDLLVRITYQPEVDIRRGAPARVVGLRRLR